MRFSYELLDELSTEYGIDIDAMMEILGTPKVDENGDDYWEYPDGNGNYIPDILESLITDPVVTNPSQGGAQSD